MNKKINIFKQNVIDALAIFIIAFILTFSIVGVHCIIYHKDTPSPVEENTHIDSLITSNDSIKLKVEHLDSIKNAKIIEVESLDNDSTVKLFYKLVSE